MKTNQSEGHKRDIILGYRDSQDWDRDCTEKDLEKIDQKIADYYKQKELNAVHSLEHAQAVMSNVSMICCGELSSFETIASIT